MGRIGINKENINEENKHERQIALDAKGSLRKTMRVSRSGHCEKLNCLL